MPDYAEMNAALQKGNAPLVGELTKKALDEGASPKEVLDKGLIAAMGVVGEKFKKNEVYVPEVLIAARAMHAGLAVLEPILAETGVEPIGVFMIGTVKGDLHDIGKNLVAMMVKGAGYKVVDLGIDVTPDKFVEAVKKEKPGVIGLSALLTTTMPMMKSTIEAVRAAGVDVKIIVGGAPVTQAYADEIGADGYSPDAASAVGLVKELTGVA
ncbi:MAG: corrinoid protein [Planctomycetes bacterium]|nr:corrinoid protein [Planctomycetota bacterium]